MAQAGWKEDPALEQKESRDFKCGQELRGKQVPERNSLT